MRFSRMGAYNGNEFPVIVQGKGVSVWNQYDKRYIDSLAGLFTSQVGYGRPTRSARPLSSVELRNREQAIHPLALRGTRGALPAPDQCCLPTTRTGLRPRGPRDPKRRARRGLGDVKPMSDVRKGCFQGVRDAEYLQHISHIVDDAHRNVPPPSQSRHIPFFRIAGSKRFAISTSVPVNDECSGSKSIQNPRAIRSWTMEWRSSRLRAREIARHLGRRPSTTSMELRHNAEMRADASDRRIPIRYLGSQQ